MKKNAIVVLVTCQRQCARLIHAGARLHSPGAELIVLSVRPEQAKNYSECTELEYLYQACSTVDASMTVLYDKASPIRAIARYLRRFHVRHIVIGVPESFGPDGFAGALHSALPKVPLSIVTASGEWHAFVPVPKAVPVKNVSLSPAVSGLS